MPELDVPSGGEAVNAAVPDCGAIPFRQASVQCPPTEILVGSPDRNRAGPLSAISGEWLRRRCRT